MTEFPVIQIKGHSWQLLPEKAVYWLDRHILILSDIHLGKAGHFRKSGIPAPESITQKNLVRIGSLIEQYQPETVLILGDLFHSDANREWFLFETWLDSFPGITFKLVSGNHDSLHTSFYEAARIEVTHHWEKDSFIFVHNPADVQPAGQKQVLVAGHIHPCIILRGKGRQSLRLPCFLFSDDRVLFPAFGEFTGHHAIKPKETDRVFVAVEGNVMEIINQT